MFTISTPTNTTWFCILYPNQDQRYEDFIGDQSPLTGASLQLRNPELTDVHARVLNGEISQMPQGKNGHFL